MKVFKVILGTAFLAFSYCALPFNYQKVGNADSKSIYIYRNQCIPAQCSSYTDNYSCFVEKTGELNCTSLNEKYKNPIIIGVQ